MPDARPSSLCGRRRLRDFRADIIDLFERKRGGHVQHWLYSDTARQQMTGSELWRAFTRSSRAYYIPRDEISLIAARSPGMLAQSAADTVVDFGVGSVSVVRNKVMPIISGLDKVKIYAGVDISEDMLSQAANAVHQDRPDLSIETYHQNFHHGRIELGGHKRLGLLFGCSVTNQNMKETEGFPHDEIVKNLKDFQTHLGQDGELLITYDANTNSQQAMESYDNPYWPQHVTGLMYDIERMLKIGGDFDPAAWEHEKHWDHRAHVIHQCVVASRAQTLVMEDREYHFRRGERFVTINCFKFPDDLFDSLCDEAGFKTLAKQQLNTLRLQHLAV